MMSIELTQNLLAQFAAGFEMGAISWGLAHLSLFLVRKFQVQPAAIASVQEPFQLIAVEQPLPPQPDQPQASEVTLTSSIELSPQARLQPADHSEPVHHSAPIRPLSVRQLRTIAKHLSLPNAARLRSQDQKIVLSRLTAIAIAL